MKSLEERKILEETLTASRFRHTLGVMYTGGDILAMKYSVI